MARNLPNLLLIQADQLKPQVLPAYGGPALTPHLDRLCGEGMVFENAYCNFPLCAPSRFSMLAGMLPSRVRAFDNAAEFPAATPTVAHYLRLAGYRTALAGKQHFVGPDMLHGFHERLLPELYPTDFHWTPDWDETRMESNNDSSGVIRSGVCERSMQMDHDEAVLARSAAWLSDAARRADGQPFFLCASFTHPHEPYFARREHWGRYRHEDVPMPATPLPAEAERDLHSRRMLAHHGLLEGDITEAHVRTARHAYLANCSWLDDMVGTLLEALAAGGADDTVVIVTSDHGDMLGERGLWFKKHFFEHAARVPLVLHAPRRFAAARRSEPVSLVDLLPTLCELAGIDLAARAPRPPDGASLLASCRDPDAGGARPVFAEMTSEGVPSPMFMVRRGRFKLMTGGGAPDLLFNLEADPEERHDLAADPASGDVLAALRRLAETSWDATALEEEVRASQRERRLVQAAHRLGPAPSWDALESDPVRASCLRAPDDYNDWAWRGIEPSAR